MAAEEFCIFLPRQFLPTSSATEPLPPDFADRPIELPEAPGVRRTSVILVVAPEALLGSWGISLEACPELGTPATPARPRSSGRPDAAFRLVNSVGIATSRVFGAESSRPASLLCTLRTHQSPGEWQHLLSACVLALAVRDLHPLDSIKGFHRLIFGSSSSTLSPAR